VTSRVLIAGVHTVDRVRGGGWLDCPNCGEHASQDVVDEMRFLALLGYRFTPVRRRRVLVCRRCNFRRAATPEELARLSTGGRRIQRAWLVPMGLLPFVLVGVAALFLALRHPPSIEDVLAFAKDTTQPVAPATLRRPLTWNASPNTDDVPPDYTVTDPTQRMVIRLRRITDSSTIAELIANHLTDDNGINDLGVPTAPPPASQTRIAGENALWVRFDYTSTGEDAETTLYAFFHDGIGYTLSYIAKGKPQFTTVDQVAEKVNASLSFTGSETPAPCPSASPAASPSPSPQATGQPLPSFATSPQPCAGTRATPPPAPTPAASPTPG